jgi:hypothetical protein
MTATIEIIVRFRLMEFAPSCHDRKTIRRPKIATDTMRTIALFETGRYRPVSLQNRPLFSRFLIPSALNRHGLPCTGASIPAVHFQGRIVMSRTGLTLGLILAASIVSSAAVAYPACETPLVFSIKQNKCVPPPPVRCQYGVDGRVCRPPPPGVNPCATGPNRSQGHWNQAMQACQIGNGNQAGFAF